MKIEINSKNMTLIAITAALYSTLTLFLAPVGYGIVQCRISEVLCLLAFIDPVYGWGVILGCFIANFASPFGLLDVFVGTFASFLSVLFIRKSKSLFVATLWPTFFCFIVAGVVSYFENVPYLITCASIMAGEFAVVTIIGYPLFKYICFNKKIYNLLKFSTR